MIVGHRRLGRCGAFLSGALLTVAAGLSSPAADADQIIVFEGISKTTESTAGQMAVARMSPEQRASFCGGPFGATSIQIATTIDDLHTELSDQLGSADPDLKQKFEDMASDAEGRLDKAWDDACRDPDTVPAVVQLVYSTCRMTMRDGTSMIDVRFPPGSGGGWLTFLNPATFEAIEMNIGNESYRNFEFTDAMNQQTGMVQGTDTDSIVGPGVSRDVELRYNFTQTLPLTGGEYTFDFQFELSLMRSLMGAAALGGDATGGQVSEQDLAQVDQFLSMFGKPKIHSWGSALIVPMAPGLDILRAFYQTFAAAMGAEGSYLSGLYNHKLLEYGMPIELDQTTEMAMTGMPGIGAFGGQRSTSTMKITSIIGPLSTDLPYCDKSIVPPDYTVSNPTEQASGAGATGSSSTGNSAAPGGSSGAPGGVPVANGGSGSVYNLDDCDTFTEEALANVTPEERDAILQRCPNLALSQGMNALNEAMENMTPEQQAAMQQFGGGFGALLGGLTGGSGAATPAATPSAPAGAARATRTGPSSAELMTDDLTESAQKLLQALGYDPGNTDGELGVDTTIAISQFQAEKGLEVTGEVTPQLVGILAAEVDGR